MALIVRIRRDGTLALDPRGDAPAQHGIPLSSLERWGVTPGKPFTLATEDGDVSYSFAGFGTKLSQGEEVPNTKLLNYERDN